MTDPRVVRFFVDVQGKSRLILEADNTADGKGTNVMLARANSPNLDDPKIAHVGKPI